MNTKSQAFGFNISTGYVEAVTLHLERANGAFAPAADPLDAMTTQELEVISQQATAEMDAAQHFAKQVAS